MSSTKNKISINFKQPKFILPLIVLPFITFFTFIINSWAGGNDQEITSTAGDEALNYDLPESSSEVKDQDLKNKLEAFRQVYGKNTDRSALMGLGDLEEIDNEFESAYTTEDERLLAQLMQRDSTSRALNAKANDDLQKITNLLAARGNPQKQAEIYASMSQRPGDESDEFRKTFGHLFEPPKKNYGNGAANYGQYGTARQEDDFEAVSMRLFKQQMEYIDSVNTAKAAMEAGISNNTMANNTKGGGINNKNFQPERKDVLPVRYSKPPSSFNTVYSTKKPVSAGIPAIIDEDKKAIASTRIRLKLMSDMYVGDHLLKRGTYLYAFVSGFSTQRVMLSVTQVMHNGENLNVNLDVFDNDGYLGLYVPGSVFREFTKEIGDQSSRGLTSITTAEDQNQLTQNFIKSLFSGGANAASKLIKANKAQFKYNYVIYLKENTSAKELSKEL